jgi:ribosomal protein S12 methylthiotransferase
MSHAFSRIGFVSLGCPKALVDSERIMTHLRSEGYELVNTYDKSDLVIINTCGFIESAIQESFDTIEEAMNENGKVIVTGCLGKNKQKLLDKFPDLLAITGPQQYESVMEAVHQHLPPKHNPHLDLLPPEGIKLTPRHYAYLKISEGCNHKCKFCIIPQLRGKLKSRPANEILYEAERLVRAGVKELLIVSQDTSAYGIDLKYAASTYHGREIPADIASLSEALGELDAWIRLHYVYPYPHVDKLIPMMADNRILPYLDIPLQHASPTILKAMKRPACTEDTLSRIMKWREICPDIAIRSTFIVGYPGETEEDFITLLDFLDEAKLDRVGAFKYSPVEGALANALPDHIPEYIKEERLEQLMHVQADISLEKMQQKVGQHLEVMIDEISETGITARTKSDAPEVDGSVTLPPHPTLQAGDKITVKITDASSFELVGEY